MSSAETVPSTTGPSTAGPTTGASERALWDAAADAFRRWQSGADPVDPLVRVMTPVLWHVVRAYGLDEELARDVVQTTWLALVRRAGSIADPQAVAAWLTVTARREAWRAAKRAATTVAVDDEVLDVVVDAGESAEDSAVQQDQHRRLWAGVATLDERCQRLLRIVAFDARPDYARIASDLGMAVGSIGPTRGRCLDKLRTAVRENGGVS
ncbi:RNA polymerase sigma factor [Conyzicola lurida]|nr:sigma-70 family RNA polymerase sigma factor [Conyzicola lurida]